MQMSFDPVFSGKGYVFPRPKETLIWFGVPFLIAWGLYFLYNWVVILVLEASYDPPDVRDTYSWGDGLMLFVGFYLMSTNRYEWDQQRTRFVHMITILNDYYRLADTLVRTANPDVSLVVTLTHDGGAVQMDAAAAVQELVGIMLTSAVQLVWQMTSKMRDFKEAFGICDVLGSHNRVYSGQVPKLYREAVGPTRQTIAPLTMLSILSTRVTSMAGMAHNEETNEMVPSVVLKEQRVLDAISRVSSDINSMVVIEETRLWPVISILNKVLGVLYLIALPWILWPSQGRFIWASTAVVFVTVGCFISYIIFIGDIYKHPTDAHMGHVYDRLLRLELDTGFLLTNRYPHLTSSPSPPVEVVSKFFTWKIDSKGN